MLTRCSPTTFTTPTPADGPDAGCSDTTVALGWNSNSTLLVLKPPSVALTSTVTMPAAWGGAMHATSTQPMHCSERCVIVERPVAFAGRTAELISLVHSSSPPMYSPATTSSPNLQSTFSPTRLLPMTCTTVPPDTGPDAGAIANTVADDMYSNASSDVLHTSLFTLAATEISPLLCAGEAHSTPNPAARLRSGAMVPNLHVKKDAVPTSRVLIASRTTVPPLCDPSRVTIATTAPSSMYSYMMSLWLNCSPWSLVLISITTLLGS